MTRTCSECTAEIQPIWRGGRRTDAKTCSASCASERKVRLQEERRHTRNPKVKTRWSPRKEKAMQQERDPLFSMATDPVKQPSAGGTVLQTRSAGRSTVKQSRTRRERKLHCRARGFRRRPKTLRAFSPDVEILVSDDRGQAKGPPMDPVSPGSVA